MTAAPVIPCVIIGSDRCYILDRLWRPWRRIPVWIAFGEPLLPGARGSRDALEASLARAFRQLAAELRDHFHLTEEDLPQSAARRRAA
jgi:hypothetical protein